MWKSKQKDNQSIDFMVWTMNNDLYEESIKQGINVKTSTIMLNLC